jgi:hypothetical protein
MYSYLIYSISSSFAVKNDWNCDSTTLVCRHGVDRDNFTVLILFTEHAFCMSGDPYIYKTSSLGRLYNRKERGLRERYVCPDICIH